MLEVVGGLRVVVGVGALEAGDDLLVGLAVFRLLLGVRGRGLGLMVLVWEGWCSETTFREHKELVFYVRDSRAMRVTLVTVDRQC